MLVVCDVVARPNVIVPVCEVPPTITVPVVCEVARLMADVVVSKVTPAFPVKLPTTVTAPVNVDVLSTVKVPCVNVLPSI